MPVKISKTSDISAWGDGHGSVVIDEIYDGEVVSSVTIGIYQLRSLFDAYDQLKHEAFHGFDLAEPRD